MMPKIESSEKFVKLMRPLLDQDVQDRIKSDLCGRQMKKSFLPTHIWYGDVAMLNGIVQGSQENHILHKDHTYNSSKKVLEVHGQIGNFLTMDLSDIGKNHEQYDLSKAQANRILKLQQHIINVLSNG